MRPPLRSMLHRLCFALTVFVLVFLPGATPQPTSSLPLTPLTTHYLLQPHLRRLQALRNVSKARLTSSSPPTQLIPYPVHTEANLIYIALTNTTQPSPLTPQKRNGRYTTSFTSLNVATQITDAFVSRVQANASEVRQFVIDVTNATIVPGDVYEWIGGYVRMFTVGSSTVHAIGMSCNVMLFYDQQGKLRTVPRYSFVRSYPPYQSKIIRMLPTHSTTLCEGDGAIFAEHERASQRLWLSSAGTKAKTATSAGDIITENLNDGNAVLNPAQEVIEALEKLEDVVDAAPANSLSRALDEAEKEFNRGLEAYNNVAFLILSVAAVLSSTAVASISIGSDCDRVAIVMVEAAVIYSFLAIVTHACVVFLRDDTFLIDARDVGVGNFTSSAGIVEVYSETIFLAVGGRTRAPKFLIVTEVFAAIAAVVVSLSVIQSVRWVRRSGRRELVADDVMRDEEDELFSEYSEKEL